MELWRIAEIILFSLINFLPCFLMALYPFRRQLRYSRLSTGVGIALNTLVHTACTLLKFVFPEWTEYVSLVCTAAHALSMYIWIDAHFGKSIFTLLMMTNISNFIMVASKCLEGLLFWDLAQDHNRWSHSLTMALVDAVVLIPLFFYIRHIFVKAVQQDTARKTWYWLWLIPLTFYAVWFRNFYFSAEGAMTLALRPRHTLYSAVINAGALLTYMMIARLIRESAENESLREREHQLSMQQAQYTYLQDRIEEARKLKHDTRQHIHVISAYLQARKYEELEQYMGRYEKMMPEDGPIRYCDHFAVNALLQYFGGYAKRCGIGFSTAIALPAQVDIPEEALTVAMGNLLENALEACLDESNPGGVISVRGKCDARGVFFKVINSCPLPPKTDKQGRFLSRKRKGLGIGMQSVQDIAQRCGGMMKVHWEDGVFSVSVLLLPEDKAGEGLE